MTSIRTILIKESKHFYISLSDTYDFLVESNILTRKQANKWIWDCKKSVIKKLSKMFSEGETDNFTEPIIPKFNDYFLHYTTLIMLLPEKENEELAKFNRQFAFVHNCEDEYFFEEQSYVFENHLIEKATFNFNRIRQ